jgi:hypothetical protein
MDVERNIGGSRLSTLNSQDTYKGIKIKFKKRGIR